MIFPLSAHDKGFLLSSDGLYDELKTSQVLKMYEEKKKESHPVVIDKLLESAIQHAARTNNHTLEEVKKMSPGKSKRNIHDDLTLLYVNLEGQVS
jgi:serine/threonine protein phosphatase PrpC